MNAPLKLRLYIGDPTFESTAAIAQVHALLQKWAADYALEVFHVEQHRDQAIQDEVPFTPLLLRLEPLPVARIAMPASNLDELETELREMHEEFFEPAIG